MRRKDREVTKKDEIMRIINDCRVMVLGLNDSDQPYLVPLNFTWQQNKDELNLYFHCAKKGYKLDLIKINNNCSFVLFNDLGIKTINNARAATNYYESIFGTGKAEVITNFDRKKEVAALLLKKYNLEEVLINNKEDNDAAIDNTAFVKITVKSVSAKANREEKHDRH